VSCYEAGRDGFWLHRALAALGVTNHVVDSASIEGNGRRWQAKSDRHDAVALLDKLDRYVRGGRRVWSVVRVPSVDEEDRRHLHRELFTVTRERARVTNRIKGLLALHGVVLPIARGLPSELPADLRAWDGAPLPPHASACLTREWRRLTFLRREVRALIAERRRWLREGDDAVVAMVRRLLALRGVGEVSAWLSRPSSSPGGSSGTGAKWVPRRASRPRRGGAGARRPSKGSARRATASCARSRSSSRGAGCAASRGAS
jgi:transposase